MYMTALYHSKGSIYLAEANDGLMWAMCKPQTRFKMCASHQNFVS